MAQETVKNGYYSVDMNAMMNNGDSLCEYTGVFLLREDFEHLSIGEAAADKGLLFSWMMTFNGCKNGVRLLGFSCALNRPRTAALSMAANADALCLGSLSLLRR